MILEKLYIYIDDVEYIKITTKTNTKNMLTPFWADFSSDALILREKHLNVANFCFDCIEM